MTPRLERLWRSGQDAACVVAVMLMAARSHYGIRAVRNIGPDDEGWYLASGALLGKPGFPNGSDGWPIADQGPVYSLWYFVLSKIWRAPLDLYFGGWHVLTTALALAIFVVARRLGSRWWQALLASFFYVNSGLPDVWPFPLHFATLLILVGVAAASLARSRATMLSVVALTLGLAGFVRPELLAAYGVALVVVVVHAARHGYRTRKWRSVGQSLLVAACPGLVLPALFGNPLGGTRSFLAFAQHYTVNVFTERHVALNPWANWITTMTQDFPGATTIGQALRVNPAAFLAHVARNAGRMPTSFLVVSDSLDASKSVQVALVVVGICFAVGQLRRAARSPRRIGRDALVLALACCALPFAVSCLVIYPRSHYFVPVAVLAATLVFSSPFAALGLSRRRSPGVRAVAASAFSALLVVATASRSGAPLTDWLTRRPDARAPFGDRQRTIIQLRELRLKESKEPLVALEESWGTCFYAGYVCRSYQRWDKLIAFDAFAETFGIDVLVVDEAMRRDVRFVGDPDFADLLRDPGRHGFVMSRVPGTPVLVGHRPALTRP